MKVFLLLLALISTGLACKCAEFDDKKTFCGADWVSHVNVTKKITDGETTHYTVKHIDIFKKPTSLKTLPCDIYTAAHTATCGVDINVGVEYLLAGTYDKTKKQLKMATCGQFQPQTTAGITVEEKMRWWFIPKETMRDLRIFKC